MNIAASPPTAQRYTGSNFNKCAYCGEFGPVAWQVNLGGFDYRYYCRGHLPAKYQANAPKLPRVPRTPRQSAPVENTARHRVLQALEEKPRRRLELKAIASYKNEEFAFDSLISDMTRRGQVVKVTGPGHKHNAWYCLPNRPDQVALVEAAIESAAPQLTRLQRPIADFLKGNPTTLDKIAEIYPGHGSFDACRLQVKEMVAKGLVIHQRCLIDGQWWHVYALAEDAALLGAIVGANGESTLARIAAHVRANPGATVKEIMAALDLCNSSVYKALPKLAGQIRGDGNFPERFYPVEAKC